MLKNILFLVITIMNSHAMLERNDESMWTGKWFPYSPGELDSNPTYVKNNFHDIHMIKMGVRDSRCDDAKTNLELDWFMNPENYTCYDNKKMYLPNSGLHPIHSTEFVPSTYHAPHACMNESIYYREVIPTFGTHRPLWAVYGEYDFLPKQRWLHNLEHGAVVMLYHPCANKNEVEFLKNIVKSCLYRHIITPYNLLSPTRPLVLVTWGHRLEISKVSVELAVDFITKHALRGPEKISEDGQYDLMLNQHAKIVSDQEDNLLCSVYGPSQIDEM